MNSAKSCLLIDDDADDQAIFLQALTDIAPDTFCISASGPSTAISLLKDTKYQPDYIFLDLNLPEMNGLELLQFIKRNKDFCNIPVIIYSTSSMPREVAQSYQFGAHGFFTKSVKYTDICTMLRAFF
jgi:CheY-like chemotaxis protein